MTDKTAILYRMDTPDHVCPYGLKSRHLLRRKGYDVEDHTLDSRAAADSFKVQHGVSTTPQTFINGRRIGGYDDLQRFFGSNSGSESEESTTYTPVVMLFALAALMAAGLAHATEPALFSMRTLVTFVALSMCLLALQKLRDLEAFSLQFLAYDLLAQRWVPYAMVYPFVEALAGIGMLANIWAPAYAVPALFIGTVGEVSVFKAVYLDKRELKCACVGGNSNVPLGFVSLTENLMMILMPLHMLMA